MVVLLAPVLMAIVRVLTVMMMSCVTMRFVRVSGRSSLVRVSQAGRHKRAHHHRKDDEAGDNQRRNSAQVHTASISVGSPHAMTVLFLVRKDVAKP